MVTLAAVVLLALLPIALLSVVVHQYEIAVALGDLAQRLHERVSHRFRPRLVPEARPLEQIAVDARRLSYRVDHVERGWSYARFEASRRAYDDVLVELCRALGIDERLSRLPAGAARDQERRNLEFLLEQSGMRLRDAA